MKPPAPRYKVVERGRRLEVIDTASGKPVRPLPVPAGEGPITEPQRKRLARPVPPAAKNPAGVDDGSTFTTRRWFDDKAPRTIRMNFAARARFDQLRFGIAIVVAAVIGLSVLFWPWFPLALVAVVGQPKLPRWFRAAGTRWIDGLDQAA